MELNYIQQGDYLRRTYLQENRKAIYTGLLLSEELKAHLEEVDRQANEMLDRLIEQMKKEQGVTEELKAQDQMAWVQQMNNIRNSAEEIVLNELIYR